MKDTLSCLASGRFGISKNVKYIVVDPGTSKLPVLKGVRPCQELNPGIPRGLLNIRKMLQSMMYTQNEKVISNLVRILVSVPLPFKNGHFNSNTGY